MSESGEESKSLDVVLGVSFTGLAARKRGELLKMAVLAPGAMAPIGMLQNLWKTDVRCGFPFAMWLNPWNWFANREPGGCTGAFGR